MTDHPNLAAALVTALADLSVIEKGNRANLGTYSYSYADIADVVKLTRPRLAEHGIVALTPVHEHGSGLACTVILLHTSGERMDFGPFPFPHGRDAQATGSMVTYHRRYSLVAALGMAAGDDDDGAAAAPRQEAAQAAPAPAEAPTCPPGWVTADAWNEAKTAYADALAALPEEERQQVKATKAEQKIGWPVTPDEMATLMNLIRGSEPF